MASIILQARHMIEYSRYLALGGNQRSSEVIRGHQRSSEVIRGSSYLMSEAIRDHQEWPFVAIRGNQRQSEAISGNQRPSEGMSTDTH